MGYGSRGKEGNREKVWDRVGPKKGMKKKKRQACCCGQKRHRRGRCTSG